MDSLSGFTLPNSECVMLCPVLESDKHATGHGNQVAEEDYRRHCAQSLACSGANVVVSSRGHEVRCPLFGVVASL